MTTQFSFVNIAQGPRLDPSAVKAMRAHVTKGNFARRRRRLEQSYRHQRNITHESQTQPGKALEQSHRTSNNLQAQTSPSPISCPELTDDMTVCIQYLLQEFRPLIFPCAGNSIASAGEIGWSHLLISEPALVEASMAVGLKHHPAAKRTNIARRSHYHAYKAVRMVNQRLATPDQLLSDGLLAAVFVLSFGERLSRNEAEWSIHINGLTQMIRFRQTHGKSTIPEWFSDLIAFDLAHATMSIPGTQYNDLNQALYKHDQEKFLAMLVSARRDAFGLRDALDAARNSIQEQTAITAEIDRRINVLYPMAQLLSLESRPSIKCLGQSLLTFLSLEWPRDLLTPVNAETSFPLGFLSQKLRSGLSSSDTRVCSCLNVTIWQLFVGAAAADQGSETRSWYIEKLRTLLTRVRFLEWTNVLMAISKGLMPETNLLQRFKDIWHETCLPLSEGAPIETDDPKIRQAIVETLSI